MRSLQRNVLNHVQITRLHGIFFEENVPQMVQNYQKEEEKWYEPSAEEESTTEPDFVENM